MKRILALAACLAFFMSATVSADIIHSSGQWQPGKTPNNNTSGPNAFWDHVSSDGSHCNVGYLLSKTYGTCHNINAFNPSDLPGSNLSYLSAAGNSNAPTNFYVTPGAGEKTTFVASVAGFSGDNNQFHDVFGWALVGSSTLHPLFNSTNDASNQTATFTPGGNFRFYIAVYNVLNQLQWVHFSDTAGSYFALFSQNPSHPSGPPSFLSNYWVGAEDTHLRSGDFDYQDMLVNITPIPEPASLALFGTGLVGLAGVIRRKIARG